MHHPEREDEIDARGKTDTFRFARVKLNAIQQAGAGHALLNFGQHLRLKVRGNHFSVGANPARQRERERAGTAAQFNDRGPRRNVPGEDFFGLVQPAPEGIVDDPSKPGWTQVMSRRGFGCRLC